MSQKPEANVVVLYEVLLVLNHLGRPDLELVGSQLYIILALVNFRATS